MTRVGTLSPRLTHLCPGDHTPLDDCLWPCAKVLGLPEDEVGQTSLCDLPNEMRHSVGDGADQSAWSLVFTPPRLPNAICSERSSRFWIFTEQKRNADHSDDRSLEATHGLMVYFAIYLFTLSLSLPSSSPSSGPLTSLIFAAVLHVLAITSPILPIACESDEIMEIAPVSWRTSSAATVSARIRESAKAISSGIDLSRW